MSIDRIKHYFPKLTEDQLEKFAQLQPLYEEWNSKINVISRKDMDQFYIHHVLHALGIANVIRFKDNTSILDIGTGGGFPGIPLAILFPECNFYLVDSIGKKIKVVDEVVQALGLTNVRTKHTRAEDLKEKFDFVVSRAVTQMPIFLTWARKLVHQKHKNGLPNGILYLKGGDLKEEMKPIKNYHTFYKLSDYYTEEFFETKKVVYVRL